MRNIYNKKGDLIFGEEVLKIILAAVGIFILIGLVVKIWDSQKKTDLEKASANIDKIINSASLLNKDNPQKEEVIESPKGWYLMTTEQPNWGLCQDFFCFCFCKESNCAGEDIICKSTEKFFLLRNIRGDSYSEVRTVYIREPLTIEIKYKDGLFYPFNQEEDFSNKIPIFLRFHDTEEGLWEWSFDLENWVGTNELIMRGGLWDKYSPPRESKKLLEEFNSNISRINYEPEISLEQKKEILKTKGIEFLQTRDIGESQGVIILQVKK